MERLGKRVEDLVRDWGVVIHGTMETQSSFIGFGKRGDHDVALKVIRQPGDEWRCGAVMAAFGAGGMARVYEYIEGSARRNEASDSFTVIFSTTMFCLILIVVG